MNAVEIIALIFAIVVLVKTVAIILVKPKLMLGLAEKMLKQRVLLTTVLLIGLGAVTYLFLQTMNITQIFVGIILGTSLFALMMIQYPKASKPLFNAIFKDKKKMWIAWIVWIVLAIWVLISLFV